MNILITGVSSGIGWGLAKHYLELGHTVFGLSRRTPKDLIKKANLKVNWFEHIQRYPLSNHLYWLANGKPGGHQVWNFLDDNVLNQKYEKQLKSKGITDTILLSIGLK